MENINKTVMAGDTRVKYLDLRYKFIRGLISYERFQRTRHWMKQAAEWTSKSIVSLDFLHNVSLKSVRQAVELEGIGEKISKTLREIMKDGRVSAAPPNRGRFASSGPALLVALYLLTEHHNSNLILESQLASVASVLTEESIENLDDQGTGRCQAWWRLNILVNRGLIKKRTRCKLPVLELLPDGQSKAKELIVGLQGVTLDRLMSGEVLGADCVRRRDEIIGPASSDHLYTNDDGSDGVVLYVDAREWGGDRRGLYTLCDWLREAGVRYATRRLVAGDYNWVWTTAGKKVELPLLVERKRADDVAMSLVDGRWGRQKESMLTWGRKYDAAGVNATLTYIVEGDAADYVVGCADGCGGVGRCGYPNLHTVEARIKELDQDANFSLIRTENRAESVDILVRMTQEMQVRTESGEFVGLVTATGDNAVHSKAPRAKKRETVQAVKTPPPKANHKAAASEASAEEVHHWTEDLHSPAGELCVEKCMRRSYTKAAVHKKNLKRVKIVNTSSAARATYTPGDNYKFLERLEMKATHWTDALCSPSKPTSQALCTTPCSSAKFDDSNNPTSQTLCPTPYSCAKFDDSRKPTSQTLCTTPYSCAKFDDSNKPISQTLCTTPYSFIEFDNSSKTTSQTLSSTSTCITPSSSTVSNDMHIVKEQPVKVEPSLPTLQRSPVRAKRRRVHEIPLDWLESDLPDVSSPSTSTFTSTSLTASSPTVPTRSWWKSEQDDAASPPQCNTCSAVVKSEGGDSSPVENPASGGREVKAEHSDDVWAKEMGLIRCVLPEVDECVARSQLERHAGNVDLAVSALLDGQI